MNQMKCLKYIESSTTSPVEDRVAHIPSCTAKPIRVFDSNGCEIPKATKNCCSNYSKSETLEVDSTRTISVNMLNYTGRNYIILPNNMIELNFDDTEVTFKYLTVMTYRSDNYNCDLPYVPNNGKLIEALEWYCMYKILSRGLSHPVYSLKSQLPTNPYLLWEASRSKAIASVIIDNQDENATLDSGWNSFFYNSTFNPKR